MVETQQVILGGKKAVCDVIYSPKINTLKCKAAIGDTTNKSSYKIKRGFQTYTKSK